MQQGPQTLVTPLTSTSDSSDWEWVAAALLFSLMLVDGIRDGGFWHADALVAAVGSIVVLIVAVATDPLDRRSGSVVAAFILLALWWGIRATAAGSMVEMLPLGASCLAGASAFAAVRSLHGPSREMAGLGLACLGAAGSLIGFAGLIWRWFPMAMPAQGLWRLSTTLTYSDAAGLVLAMCLLVVLGVDRSPFLARLAVCLCGGGLLATQSRGAYVAFICACGVVPWRRYVRFLVPLLAGLLLGAVAIATSPGARTVPWLGVALIAALGVSAVPQATIDSLARTPRFRLGLMLVVPCALVASAFLLHHEIGLRAFAPSDQDRTAEWSTAFHQWAGAPIVGVGPDRLLILRAADGASARFVHNEYLQIAADAGAIGLALLVAVGAAIFKAARRFDVLSSCACAALVCCAVGGAFDYDWHLTFVGFVGGCCAGLARSPQRAKTGGEVFEEFPAHADANEGRISEASG